MKKSLSFFIFSIYCFISLYPQNEKQCNILLLNQKLKDTVNIKAEQRKEYEREFWFLSSRYDSLGGILGYVDAMNGFYSNLKNQSNNKSNVLLSQQDIQWNYLGPIGLDFKGNLYQADNSIGRGWINSIKVINNDTIYAGARNSGLWLTQNGGDSWQNISESEPLINGIYSILIDPNNSNHLIVLTRRNAGGNLAEYSNGLYETYNHGQTWFSISFLINGISLFPCATQKDLPVKIVHHPEDFNDLFLVTQSSLYRRVDSNNWELIYHTDMGTIWNKLWNTDLVFDKSNPNIFYLGGSLIYKMTITPSGIVSANITDSVTGIVNDTIMKCMIGIADNFPDKLWFYYYNRLGSKHLVKFESNTYSYMHSVSGDGFYTMKISASENNDNIVYLGKVIPAKYNESLNTVVNISSDYLGSGESAADITDFLHADIRDMQILSISGSDRLFVGHDGGVAWGESAGGICGTNMFCWHQISDDGSDGLQTNEFYGISISNSDNIVIQGGTQDCSTFFYEESTNKWYHASYSDGLEGAISSSNPNRVVTGLGVLGNYSYALYDITDPSLHPIIASVHGSLTNRAKIEPTNQNVLYIGAEKLYKLNNCFSSTAIMTEVSTPINSRITAFDIAHINSLIIYIAEEISGNGNNAGHMWRFNPSTSSWIDISSGLTQYTNSYATDIVINPHDDYEVWVCMGQTTNDNKKVFHSIDGGANWSELSLGYPSSIPANRLLYDHVTSSLFVATDVGIFKWEVFRPEAGWIYLSETMPFKLVTDIERDYFNNRLIIGTFGRGIWEGNLPEDFCYDENPLFISNLVNWNIDQTVCSDIIVKNGGNLTISAEILLSKGATLFIENGATVVITGGHLYNGNTVISSGGSLTIINNGSIVLSLGDAFKSEIGALINLTHGSINKN